MIDIAATETVTNPTGEGARTIITTDKRNNNPFRSFMNSLNERVRAGFMTARQGLNKVADKELKLSSFTKGLGIFSIAMTGLTKYFDLFKVVGSASTTATVHAAQGRA